MKCWARSRRSIEDWVSRCHRAYYIQMCHTTTVIITQLDTRILDNNNNSSSNNKKIPPHIQNKTKCTAFKTSENKGRKSQNK